MRGKKRERGRKEVEDEYEDIRGRVKGQGGKKQHERIMKSCHVLYLKDQEQTYQHGEIFFPFEDHLMQLHLECFGYLKRGRNLSKGDISTNHIKEEDGAIAVMHPYLS